MNTPKFKPGDPVWATLANGGEVPAVIDWIAPYAPYTCTEGHTVYNLRDGDDVGDCCEPFIRPRRDDYQQHEPLGSRADLDNLIHQTDLETTE